MSDFRNIVKKFKLRLNEKQEPTPRSYLQSLSEIISSLHPISKREQRRLEIAQKHIYEVKKHVRKLEEHVKVLQEQIQVLEENKESKKTIKEQQESDSYGLSDEYSSRMYEFVEGDIVDFTDERGQRHSGQITSVTKYGTLMIQSKQDGNTHEVSTEEVDSRQPRIKEESRFAQGVEREYQSDPLRLINKEVDFENKSGQVLTGYVQEVDMEEPSYVYIVAFNGEDFKVHLRHIHNVRNPQQNREEY